MTAIDEFLRYKKTDDLSQPYPVKPSVITGHARLRMSVILAFSDAISLLFVLLIAMLVRMGSFNEVFRDFYASYLWVPVLILLIIYFRNGLYPAIGLSAVEELRCLSLSSTLLFLILIAITFLLKTSLVYSRIVFLLAWAFALFVLPLMRNLTRAMSVRLNIWGEPVGIVGFPDRRLIELAGFFENFPQRGIVPSAIFMQDIASSHGAEPGIVFPLDTLETKVKQLRLKTVLVVVPNLHWAQEELDKYRYSFQRVILVRDRLDSFSLIDSIALDFNGVSGFQVCHNLISPWSMALKRAVDIVVSVASIVLLSPLMAVIALLIHLTSQGGVFFRQARLGRDGKVFHVLKFRTMVINADQVFEAKLNENKAFRDEWHKYQKVRHDPRITPVGAFLRKTSLDELPQLSNILKGEMSLIGPRPIMLSQQEIYGPRFKDYARVRPGVTGLWQVSGRNHTTFRRRVDLDMEYIQRWSLWLDLYIAFMTVREVIRGDGAY